MTGLNWLVPCPFHHTCTESYRKLQETLEKSLREQTRFFFLAWAVVLASIIGLYARP